MPSRALRTLCGLLALIQLASSAHAVTYKAFAFTASGFYTTTGVASTNTIQVGTGGAVVAGGESHAVLWKGYSASGIDLNPPGPYLSYAFATTDTTQVGYLEGSPAFYHHAVLWHGTAESFVDLNPSAAVWSEAYGVDGNIQVGSADGYATIWSGTAASAVNVHPAGFRGSEAHGVSGNTQVGFGLTNDYDDHALLWHGSAASFVDLNPAWSLYSFGYGAFGEYQVGYAYPAPNTQHATLWHGTAASAVDLHPAGFDVSSAVAIYGNTQVGTIGTIGPDSFAHAAAWNGTAASFIDLHPFLAGSGLHLTNSFASGIAPNGTIIGWGYDENSNSFALLWTPESGIAGDYNNDGVVDGGDYITWRKGSNQLFNEVATPGSNSIEDFNYWRTRSGRLSAVGLEGTRAPEPTSCLLASGGVFVALFARGRHRRHF